MGLITRSLTFTTNMIPSATQWNTEFDTVYNVVNGALDAANVDKTSADGIMVLNTAQTRTGTLTHNGDIIVGNGYGLTIGNASQVTTSAAGEFQVLGTAAADSTAIIGRFAADASPPILSFLKSRHATIGSNTIVADNDVLGQIEFMGADGSDFATPGASIFARVNGTPGANDMPTELVLAVTADAGSSVTERVNISAAGVVAVTGSLTVSTTTTFTGVTTHGGNVVSDTDSTDNLGTTSVRWANVYTDSIGDVGQALTVPATISATNATVAIDLVTLGNRIDLDADNDTSIRCTADDEITVEIGGELGFILTGTTSADKQLRIDGNAERAILRLETDSGSTQSVRVEFFEGAGDGTANDMQYQIYYSTSSNYIALYSADTDGSATGADIWRVPDGQTTIDANTTWDENVFDWVCLGCGKHKADRFECCGPVEWHDDNALIEQMITPATRREAIRRAERLGIVNTYGTLDHEKPDLFYRLQPMQDFQLSALAQLNRRVRELERKAM